MHQTMLDALPNADCLVICWLEVTAALDMRVCSEKYA